MTDQETIAVYNEKADDYLNCIPREKPDPSLQAFIDRLKEGDHVHDLGCGPGTSAGFMQKAGLKVDASDASSEMVRLTRENHGIDAQHATFDELSGKEIYDGIWANFSLLHAPRESFDKYLNCIHDALKPEGIFHIGLKLGRGSKRDKLGRLYTYYEEDELHRFLDNAGFVIEETKTFELKGLTGDMEAGITVRSRKK